MAHLQSRAMPQERDPREHGTTLSLCVKVGKAAMADPDLEGGGGRGHADPEIRGPGLKENKGDGSPLDPPLGKLYFVSVVIYFIFFIVILMVVLSLT